MGVTVLPGDDVWYGGDEYAPPPQGPWFGNNQPPPRLPEAFYRQGYGSPYSGRPYPQTPGIPRGVGIPPGYQAPGLPAIPGQIPGQAQGGLPAVQPPPAANMPTYPGQNAYPGGGVRIGTQAQVPPLPNSGAVPPEATPGVLSRISNLFTQPTGETLTPRALPSPSVSGILGAMPWLNPVARGAIAAAGAMSATPAETGELPGLGMRGRGGQPGYGAPTGGGYGAHDPMSVDLPRSASPTVNGPIWGKDRTGDLHPVYPPPPRRPKDLGAPKGAPSQTPRPASPNLGYYAYAPQTGNARAAQRVQLNPNDPRLYLGPGSLWR